MTARRTRPRGFADWNPRPDTLDLVTQVRVALDREAQARGDLVEWLERMAG